VRQKAGELLHRTAKQVLPENALKPRRGRAGHHRRARSVVQQEEAECDLQVSASRHTSRTTFACVRIVSYHHHTHAIFLVSRAALFVQS
jgi:hypothetical protein